MATHSSILDWKIHGQRSLCPWDSPDKNTGMDCHVLPKVVIESHEDTGILGPWRRRIQSGASDKA